MPACLSSVPSVKLTDDGKMSPSLASELLVSPFPNWGSLDTSWDRPPSLCPLFLAPVLLVEVSIVGALANLLTVRSLGMVLSADTEEYSCMLSTYRLWVRIAPKCLVFSFPSEAEQAEFYMVHMPYIMSINKRSYAKNEWKRTDKAVKWSLKHCQSLDRWPPWTGHFTIYQILVLQFKLQQKRDRQ